MADKDYYKLLGLNKSATKEDIKKSYKKLAMQFHPDRAPEEKKKEYEEKFKEISEAAAVLSDEKKRQQYDQYGSSSFSGGGGAGGHGAGFEGYDFSDIMSQFRSGDFDDVFDHIFSGGSSSRSHVRVRRGSDLAYEIEITLEEAAKGVEKTIPLNKLEHCSACNGQGATQFETCHHCNGTGYLRKVQRTPFGIFQQSGPCAHCRGKGKLPENTCKECDGEGLVRKKKQLEVNIPAGVEEGMRLRLAGEGEAGEGRSGDLYLVVHIQEHEYFQREGNDLYLTIPISFTQAVLGDEIEVPIINGKATITIPAGTASETTFRMRGKGMPSVHGDHGDQMVKVKIEVPKKLTKKQTELIKQLKEEKPSKGLFGKIFG